ncbi:hypothetical protein HDU88_000406 [Geranomyces variabilis]|nr:hypothetical protein HDU88_000406 [Geranomyces variabilis]
MGIIELTICPCGQAIRINPGLLTRDEADVVTSALTKTHCLLQKFEKIAAKTSINSASIFTKEIWIKYMSSAEGRTCRPQALKWITGLRTKAAEQPKGSCPGNTAMTATTRTPNGRAFLMQQIFSYLECTTRSAEELSVHHATCLVAALQDSVERAEIRKSGTRPKMQLHWAKGSTRSATCFAGCLDHQPILNEETFRINPPVSAFIQSLDPVTCFAGCTEHRSVLESIRNPDQEYVQLVRKIVKAIGNAPPICVPLSTLARNFSRLQLQLLQKLRQGVKPTETTIEYDLRVLNDLLYAKAVESHKEDEQICHGSKSESEHHEGADKVYTAKRILVTGMMSLGFGQVLNTVHLLSPKTWPESNTTTETQRGYFALLSKTELALKAIITVSSGLKHEQNGSDLNPYGTARIFTKTKDTRDNFTKYMRKWPVARSKLTHVYRDMCRKALFVPTAATLMSSYEDSDSKSADPEMEQSPDLDDTQSPMDSEMEENDE